MKYNFDEVIDRTRAAGSYSSKWANDPDTAARFGAETAPEDRLCFFVADMDFRCAPEILEGIQTVTDHGILGYSAIPDAYYQAVIRWMKDRFNLNVKKEEIRTSSGARDMIYELIEQLTKPGDGIVVPLPSYYYRADIKPLNRHYVGFPMKCDDGYYTFDWEAFENLCRDPRNSMALLQQPHNPTGRIWTEDEIRKIADICRKNHVIMLCDDVHMDFKRKENKVLPFINVVGPEGIVMITGLGKTFNLAGLAITNVIVQDENLRNRLIDHSHSIISPFNAAACIAAYTRCDEWVDQLNDYIDSSIDYVVERIRSELPKVKVRRPEGTFILWLDFTGLGLTSEELDRRIADKAHVGLTDGAGMEPPAGTIFRRMCVTAPKSVLKEALDRIVAVLKDANA